MSGTLTPPSSINDARTRAHITIGARLGNLDLTQILVYVISNVPESALPALAWQFDVQSAFWSLLAPGASQRQLIQQAIPLHATRGTPAVIQNIVVASGFPSPTILEGQDSWGGSAYPPDEGWAVFRVLIPRNGQVITNVIQTSLIAAINFFRSAARPLDQLDFVDLLTEIPLVVYDTLVIKAQNFIQEPPIVVTDFLTAPGFFMSDTKITAPLYNGHFYYSGGVTYGGTQPSVVDSGIVVGGIPVV
jgi:P2-related tail formation protein